MKPAVDSKDKGPAGEQRLNSWFQENGINYLSVKQTPDTFAHLLTGNAKRPDFLIILESLGIIAVDAKNCRTFNGFFTLKKDEVKRAIAFEIITRLPFWFLFLYESGGFSSWYWISALHALEVGIQKKSTNGDFLTISLSEFVHVRNHEDIGKLYNNRLRNFPSGLFDKI